MATLKDLSNQLQSIKKQLPFAAAQALTSVARQIAAAQKVGMQRNLDNPTPFTVNSVGSFGARKDRLQAKVFVRDILLPVILNRSSLAVSTSSMVRRCLTLKT